MDKYWDLARVLKILLKINVTMISVTFVALGRRFGNI